MRTRGKASLALEHWEIHIFSRGDPQRCALFRRNTTFGTASFVSLLASQKTARFVFKGNFRSGNNLGRGVVMFVFAVCIVTLVLVVLCDNFNVSIVKIIGHNVGVF